MTTKQYLSKQSKVPFAEYDSDKIDDLTQAEFDHAVALMDDDLREEVHAEIAPCTNEEFLAAYMGKHFRRYDEEFCF